MRRRLFLTETQNLILQNLHLELLDSNGVVEIGRLSAKTIHATHYLKFSVKITTNQLHYHFKNKVPFLKKKVSRFVLESEDLLN